jgi:hypothetical protein
VARATQKSESHAIRHQASRSRPVQARATELDRVIHEPIRLGIVSALAGCESMTFNELKELVRTTDGNLSVHARKLRARDVLCEKSFEGRIRGPPTVWLHRRSARWKPISTWKL